MINPASHSFARSPIDESVLTLFANETCQVDVYEGGADVSGNAASSRILTLEVVRT